MAGHAGNTACARGADDEFGKGGNAYDRYYGDPDQVGKPSLGPLDEPAITAYRFSPARSAAKAGRSPIPTAGTCESAAMRPSSSLTRPATHWTASTRPATPPHSGPPTATPAQARPSASS